MDFVKTNCFGPEPFPWTDFFSLAGVRHNLIPTLIAFEIGWLLYRHWRSHQHSLIHFLKLSGRRPPIA